MNIKALDENAHGGLLPVSPMFVLHQVSGVLVSIVHGQPKAGTLQLPTPPSSPPHNIYLPPICPPARDVFATFKNFREGCGGLRLLSQSTQSTHSNRCRADSTSQDQSQWDHWLSLIKLYSQTQVLPANPQAGTIATQSLLDSSLFPSGLFLQLVPKKVGAGYAFPGGNCPLLVGGIKALLLKHKLPPPRTRDSNSLMC